VSVLIIDKSSLRRAPRLPYWTVPDLISIVFLSGLIVLVLAAREHITDWHWLLARYAILLVLQAGVAAGRGRGLPRIIAAFFPLVPVLGIYDSLGFIPELNPGDRDDVLIWLDRAVLGGDPSVWLQRIGTPWLTELLQLAYLVYYVLPFVLLGTLYCGRPRLAKEPGQAGEHGGAFDLCVVALLLSHYLAFTGHMAIPALGPRFALTATYGTELTGLLLAEPIAHFLDVLEGIKRDAFPSGHVSAASITIHYMLRFTARLAWCALPVVCLMIFATLYLRYHYAADILGGGMLAVFCVLLAPRLLRHEHPTSRKSH
jgi:membrane-associated phospholipid phosphatase